ncbi:Gar1/Naf1 RNA binding region-domain-containing protein [Mycena capillaripes]|nr:Gar1/Naf1 RNA binding region-domain-containing protein [Mycena capillaripes]
MSFVVPSVVSQDLLLIQDLIGLPEPVPQKHVPIVEDNIDSSDSENGSEDEIEADLVKVEDEDSKLYGTTSSAPTDSTSESESGSDSDSSDDEEPRKVNIKDLDAEEDDDTGVVAPTTTYFQTKNEVVETDIVVPDIEEVGADEVLERVGEVMIVIDNKTVIVKGAPAEVLVRASDHALDCDTLLVFEDRKVLGYIYETFGPTSQPLYQVKFNASYPLDQDKIQPSRAVFHVPQRSRFVSVSQIKRFKGSDASNMHDEEPAEDEMEFSDDEAEAAYKRRRREVSRASSVDMSRQSTPSPASMRDQDLSSVERNPYDEHSLYDDNFGSGPSRPAPMPYDDPYSDEYNTIQPVEVEPSAPAPLSRTHSSRDDFEGRTRGRGRGRGFGFDRSEGRGRGRGRDRGKGGRGRGDNDYNSRRPNERGWESRSAITRDSMEQRPHDPPHAHQPPPRSLSPTSMAIARATGQFPDGFELAPQAHSAPSTPWAFDPSHQFNYGYPPFVQPHINPRFASAFGMNFGVQQAHPPPYYQPQPSPSGGSSWTDEWTVHGGGNDPSNNEP